MTWTIQPRSDGPGALCYIQSGSGPALVLIHGVGLRAEAWSAVTPILANSFTTYAVDMPGHGASPLGDAADLSDYVARIAAFVDALDGPVCVAGHSMGALIALDLSLLRPEKIRTIAALNAVFQRSAAAAKAIQARATALETAVSPDPATTLKRWFGTGYAAEAAACRQWLTHADALGYFRAYRIFANHSGPSGAGLRSLDIPALFMTGSEDPNSTPAMSHAMATRAPHGTFRVVTGAAHMMPMTHPTEVCAAMLACFAAGDAPL